MRILAIILGVAGLACFILEGHYTRRGRRNKARKALLFIVGSVLLIAGGFVLQL